MAVSVDPSLAAGRDLVSSGIGALHTGPDETGTCTCNGSPSAWAPGFVTTSEPGRQAIQRRTRRITRICIIVVAITGVVEESRLLNLDFWRAVAFFPLKHSLLLAGIVALLYHLYKLTLRLGPNHLTQTDQIPGALSAASCWRCSCLARS